MVLISGQVATLDLQQESRSAFPPPTQQISQIRCSKLICLRQQISYLSTTTNQPAVASIDNPFKDCSAFEANPPPHGTLVRRPPPTPKHTPQDCYTTSKGNHECHLACDPGYATSGPSVVPCMYQPSYHTHHHLLFSFLGEVKQQSSPVNHL